MATIKPIEGRTIHQIQSGQVIVDLCSVVKELVENSVDAGATSIDVRFKNQGLDSIEVQDNGTGISTDNYESIALKHYTSKLATYSDLATLQTFGFRGEALSSLCALSQFSIVTCMAQDVPKGTRLEFEPSGNLKETHVVAAQKGTNVIVGSLFHNLPVRRRELQRNIKREWNKVIALLNQYACIQTGVKFSVSQQPTKGKRIILFSTKGNPSTRENLVNIFGAKTMTVLVKLDLSLRFEPTAGPSLKSAGQDEQTSTEVRVQGYVSRPAHGEGRQTPDRQMFFVNGRPCGLPQFAKVFNEVYRAYNASQSPFIFADIQLDTHLYDVNVSPDKRTIMLHDQNRMLETMKEALSSLFSSQDYSIPAAQQSTQRTQTTSEAPILENDSSDDDDTRSNQVAAVPMKPTTLNDDGELSTEDDGEGSHSLAKPSRKPRKKKLKELTTAELQSQSLISRWVGRKADDRDVQRQRETRSENSLAEDDRKKAAATSLDSGASESEDDVAAEDADYQASTGKAQSSTSFSQPQQVLDFNARLLHADTDYGADALRGGVLQSSDDGNESRQAQIPAMTPIRAPRVDPSTSVSTPRLPKRSAFEVATVSIGNSTVTGSMEPTPKRARVSQSSISSTPAATSFGSRLTQMFSASHSTRHERIVGASTEPSDNLGTAADADSDDVGASDSSSSYEVPADEITVSHDDGFESASDRPEGSSSPIPEPDVDLPSRNKTPVPVATVATNDDNSKDDLVAQNIFADNRSSALKGGTRRKDATVQQRQNVKVNTADLQSRITSWQAELGRVTQQRGQQPKSSGIEAIKADDAEEVLSLIISKSDFAKMTIVGQFNLGFIIAVRHAPNDRDGDGTGDDELFIIDQHASDEKYNFERLQSTTVVQSQRLVRPKQLELTALEEEIVMENVAALDINGFKVSVDSSGDQPVGARCKLLALPLSRETTFTLSDLEELISLLSEHHLTEISYAPRPSKVRSMFAMRACRSSVMIGKALAQRQMEKLVRHMGELDKPWNCPHGRPTMRHLSGLGPWDDRGWKENESRVDWAEYARP
ncbi:DNA mismatch repair protein MutL [Colletotrichum orchidophilum]|uniref:DNA mismatch repair protein PMS1 n=1 Tax=Colletotrichum orchidophilum TaxID=1209926 RepID=A0A1G4BQ19_9PEZI|nr:DNA mismatch repair protein MutL [Colletotrichum orchidophilum]OHF03388.1 DNA mismatch repair protein MutL [Colletotrichum orchidophilum]